MKAAPNSVEEALERKMSELYGYRLRLECCYEQEVKPSFVLAHAGDRTLGDFLSRLTCADCGCRPIAAVLLGSGKSFECQDVLKNIPSISATSSAENTKNPAGG